MRGLAAAGLTALAVTLTVAACSTAGSPTSGSATPAPAGAPSANPPAARGTTLVPMQTVNGGEFVAPSGNISCAVYYNMAGLTHAYCQTTTPPESVTMDLTGKYTTCTGEHCLGNDGVSSSHVTCTGENCAGTSGTKVPTLAYGKTTGAGPFLCTSAATGITCTVVGRGFHISASSITPA